MKIEITKEADVKLVSESRDEKLFLLGLYGKSNRVEVPTTETRPYKKRKARSKEYMKTCTVVGCEARYRGNNGRATHFSRTHGIDKDGDKQDTYNFRGRIMQVSHPVYMNSEAKYEVDTSKLRHDQA